MVTQRRAVGAEADEADGVRVLKKYPNRRLYDTRTSSYITLVDVKQMVLGMERFEVRDAKTGEDLTRSILLQIILEEETGGVPMFSTDMLAHIIRFYGHAMQGAMGSLLEKNLQTFAEMQKKAFTPEAWTQMLATNPFGGMLEQSQQLFVQMQENMAKQAETLFPARGPGKK